MKRMLTGCILSIATLAHAQTESTFEPTAEIRVRGYLEQNPTAKESEMGAHDFFLQRTKVGLSYKGAPGTFTGQVTLLSASEWGSTNYLNTFGTAGTGPTVTPTGDPATGIHSGVGNSENLFLVHEAYLMAHLSPSSILRVGRQTFTVANGAQVSENDWFQVPYSFDGILFGKFLKQAHIFASIVRTQEWPRADVGNSENNPNVTIYSVSTDVKALPEWMSLLNISVNYFNKSELNADTSAAYPSNFFINNPQVASANQTGGLNAGEGQLRYALAANMDFGDLDAKLDYVGHTGSWEVMGEELDRSGSMMQAELGYTFDNLRVYGLYHMDSGTSSTDTEVKTYNPYYYDRHKNAGFMDIYEWGNLTYFTLGATMAVSEQTSYGLHLHKFSKTEATGDVYIVTPVSRNAAVSSAAHPLRTTNDDSDLGMEIDFVAEHTMANGVQFLGQVGMFMPGAAYETGIDRTDSFTQVLVQAKKTF